ncbi:MAG: MBL fold metallo-hydrolase [Chitinophagales bacterium]|nr:MBL fold metallo-hydrolase [Chitinophagales bacterium]
MRIRVIGAAGGEVTGSAYLIQTDDANILVDAGMFQGGKTSEAKNQLPKGARVMEIDAVLLTHGHLDHTGRLPLLIKFGYNNPVYATQPTLDLAKIILMDSARLQSADAMRKNRKKFRKEGDPVATPLYNTEHVEYIDELARPVDFHRPIEVAKGIIATWIEAGHMLGSGSIELKITEKGINKTIVFSGDLGPLSLPVLRPYEQFRNADLVFMESTYGNRDHKSLKGTLEEFEAVAIDVAEHGGKILIPTFAIGRAQQLIYHLAEMFHKQMVKPFPIYVDSPMAIEAVKVYRKHLDLLDNEFQELKTAGAFPVDERYFIATPSAKESQALNEIKGPMMILAGAGMCNGGRILHHFAHNISDPKTYVLIVGYQSYGSIGRKLVDGADTIRIFGKEYKVNAKVRALNGFSAHAGQSDLINWFSSLAASNPKVVITHGEEEQRKTLGDLLKKKFGVKPVLPKLNEIVEL